MSGLLSPQYVSNPAPSLSTGRCPTCPQSSSLRIRQDHQIRRFTFLRLLLINTSLAASALTDPLTQILSTWFQLSVPLTAISVSTLLVLDVLIKTSLLTCRALEISEFVHLLDLAPLRLIHHRRFWYRYASALSL